MVSRARTKTPEPVVEPTPPRPGVLRALGLVGLDAIEPVILGALITGDPLLLIGPHGTGKSYLLTRVAEALRLECRHYNASLLNFDDLVGFPIPDAEGGLRYAKTPAAIWGAEAVFFDEVSRCRPDIQNKLFPVVHERKVQGLELKDLVYRWAAMNPPAGDDDDAEVVYRGSEPLDPALADRFAFVVAMPGWDDLSGDEQQALIVQSGAPVCEEGANQLRCRLTEGKTLLPVILSEQSTAIAEYIRLVLVLLAAANIRLSPRRAAQLLRNIAGVQAACAVLGGFSPGDGTYLALQHSFPQLAEGTKVDRLKVLAAHREAWKTAAFKPTDIRRILLAERDPIRRVMTASTAPSLSRQDFSGIVADALGQLPLGGRYAVAVTLFESGAAGNLVAAIAEQCGELYADVCTPAGVIESVKANSQRHAAWKTIESRLARRVKKDESTVKLTNLLACLFGRGVLQNPTDVGEVCAAWDDANQRLGEAA